MDVIRIRGARTHNLQGIDIDLPREPAHRDHRTLGLRQVLARLRHDLRGRPAALRRVAVRLRKAVPVGHGETRRRPHRGALARDCDRAESGVAQSALHGRDGHRGVRLPAGAVRQGRRAALPGARAGPCRADREPDGRPGPRAAGGHCGAAAGAGRAGPQGRARRRARAPARPGVRARLRGREPRGTRRRAGARCPATALDRCGRRPPARTPGRRPAPRGVVRNRALAVAGRRQARVPGRAGPASPSSSRTVTRARLAATASRNSSPGCSRSTTRAVPAAPAAASGCRSSSIRRAWW